jgi:hypothetical protein
MPMRLELSFRPTVPIITAVRRAVMSLYERALGNADVSARVGLATHELLENVLRHSIGGETTLQIRTTADVPARVVIETRNRAEQRAIDTLKAHAAAMATTDPHVYYCEVMAACALKDDDGGLGLARIRAEAEMQLDVETDGDSVRIIATTAAAA